VSGAPFCFPTELPVVPRNVSLSPDVKSQPVISLACQAPPVGDAVESSAPIVDSTMGAEGGRRWRLLGWDPSAGFTVSFAFHLLLMMILALCTTGSSKPSQPVGLLTSVGPRETPDMGSAGGELSQTVRSIPTWSPVVDFDPTVISSELMEPTDLPSARVARSTRPSGWDSLVGVDLWLATDADVRGSLDGRGPNARGRLADGEGGSPASEEAVERALRWIAAHQHEDGGWRFNFAGSLCRGQCRHPGSNASGTAATAMALLPFLGAGYTHKEGEHKQVVANGIYYLIRHATLTPDGADLQQGTMYAQGLATIAFCEAYGMTKDPALREPAQRAIDFIVRAQDSKGGGWRYTPGSPGDMTVTGWQLMALKSGQMAGLYVPSPTMIAVQRFLRSVQTEEGAFYGYNNTQPRLTTTAVGLLCRMYTGWQRTHPPLEKGVVYLSRQGPAEDNIYHNYYATQVLHHWGGLRWEQWNLQMRDRLVADQATTGHESGSWHFAGDYGADEGGRLYSTALAAMTLEVYYRHMPLYRPAAFGSRP